MVGSIPRNNSALLGMRFDCRHKENHSVCKLKSAKKTRQGAGEGVSNLTLPLSRIGHREKMRTQGKYADSESDTQEDDDEKKASIRYNKTSTARLEGVPLVSVVHSGPGVGLPSRPD